MGKRKYTQEEREKAYFNKHQYELFMANKEYEEQIKKISKSINKKGKSKKEVQNIARRLLAEQSKEQARAKIEKENSCWYKRLWIKSYNWTDNEFAVFIMIILGLILMPIIAPVGIIGLIIYTIVETRNNLKEEHEIIERFLDFDLKSFKNIQ